MFCCTLTVDVFDVGGFVNSMKYKNMLYMMFLFSVCRIRIQDCGVNMKYYLVFLISPCIVR